MERKNHSVGFVPTESFCEALTGGQPPVLGSIRQIEESLEERTLSYFSLGKEVIKKTYDNSLPLNI